MMAVVRRWLIEHPLATALALHEPLTACEVGRVPDYCG